MSESTANAPRMLWLDLFRGSAAACVIVYHLHRGLHLPALPFGYLSVDLFFVLSGMILGRRYSAAIIGGASFGEFAWARLRRLYPMVLVTAALVATLNVTGVAEGTYMTASGSLLALLSLTFLMPLPPRFGGGPAFPATSPTWSLFSEFVTNAAWFCLLRIGGKRAASLATAVAIAATCLIAVQHGNMDFGVRGSVKDVLSGVTRAMAGFGLGLWLANARFTRLPTPVALGLFTGMLCWAATGSPSPLLRDALIIATGSIMLVKIGQHEPAAPALRSFCLWMGRASFPAYLIHVPAHRVALVLAHQGVPEPLAFVAVLGGVIVVATLLNEWAVNALPGRLPFLRPQRQA